MYYSKKTDFEFFFPIINTKECDLFVNEGAYYKIKRCYELCAQLLKEMDIEKAYLADYYVNRFSISLYNNNNLEQIGSDAQWLLSYLNNGRKNSGLKHFVQRIYVSKALRNRLYIVRDILCDKNPCSLQENLEILIKQCDSIQKISEVAVIWSIEVMEFASMVEKYKFLKKINQYAKETLIAYEKGTVAMEKLIKEEGFLW